MQARLTDRPIERVIAAIQALDLESVKSRVTDPKLGEGWSRAYADSIEVAYKNYLTMLVKYQDDAEDLLLSEDVDEFWHTHILQTIKYTDDCEAVFGKYLHHAPHIGEVTETDLERRSALAEKTRRLYEKEFGKEQSSADAWSGIPIEAERAAYSGASIAAERAGYSGAAIRSGGAAYSGAAVRVDKVAYSGAAIKAERAAYSGATINTEGAAYSGVAIKAEDAAYSGAAIRAENAAYSGASVNAQRSATEVAIAA